MSQIVKGLATRLRSISDRQGHWRVFSDFVEMSAISISNAIDPIHRTAREDRYLAIANGYAADELARMAEMLADVTAALEGDHTDVLGMLFHELELHSKWHGQFFTPYALARMISEMTIGDPVDVEKSLTANGYVTALEPACGSGVMVIALAATLKDRGINYQRSLHVTAVDVDAKCVHMAYIQLSLLGIPAIVVQGNSLTLEEIGHWRTPMHVLGNWEARLRSTPGHEPG